jgi:phosphoglycolate phosphatase
MPQKITAVVFDCDGTLISSQLGILKAIQKLMTEYLKRNVSLSEVQQKYSANMEVLAERFGMNLEDSDIFSWAKKRWAELIGEGRSRYQAFEGISSLLQTLNARGVEIYVWTGGDRASTRDTLIRLDLMKYVLDMRCFDDCTPKPHPQGLAELTPHIQDKKEIIVIGDSTTDIQGALQYGAHAFAALWDPYAKKDELKGAGAEELVQTPEEFLDKMAKL